MRYHVRGTVEVEVNGWVEADSVSDAKAQLVAEIESVIPKEMYPGEIGCGMDEIPECLLSLSFDGFTVTPQVEVAIDA
jgi:hypothetical protein